MKTLSAILIGIVGVGLLIWLPFVVMLYGGIMQAIENWGINNSAVAWGLIRAILFEVGVLPGYLVLACGIKMHAEA